jgi:membrane carboxypeptidase/penicillin-binding protein PbpC
LAGLVAGWPTEHLVAIWNGLPGVEPMKTFKSAKTAASRIWERIQSLAVAAKPAAEPAKPKADTKATAATNAPKARAVAKTLESPATREGSKTAQALAMLRRKNGATLAEIVDKMGWQRHTVRGLMAGAMKKAGHAVESFKPEGGERTYRINQ